MLINKDNLVLLSREIYRKSTKTTKQREKEKIVNIIR